MEVPKENSGEECISGLQTFPEGGAGNAEFVKRKSALGLHPGPRKPPGGGGGGAGMDQHDILDSLKFLFCDDIGSETAADSNLQSGDRPRAGLAVTPRRGGGVLVGRLAVEDLPGGGVRAGERSDFL